jgi:hypothetical protein
MLSRHIFTLRCEVRSLLSMWNVLNCTGDFSKGAQCAAMACRLMQLVSRSPPSAFPHIAPYPGQDAALQDGKIMIDSTSSTWENTRARIDVEFTMLARALSADDAGLSPLPPSFISICQRVADFFRAFGAYKDGKSADKLGKLAAAFEAFMADDMLAEVGKVEVLSLMHKMAYMVIIHRLVELCETHTKYDADALDRTRALAQVEHI